MRFLMWVGIGIGAMGCMHNTSLEVLRPADVTIPRHIQSLAVIDRSAPGNRREAVGAAIEGAVTGEDIMADRQAAGAAVNAVADTLRRSPRFSVVVPAPDPRRNQSSVFDKALSFRRAIEICRPYNCQAVVALEVFDSNSEISVSREKETYEDDEGRERHRLVHRARRDTSVIATWRVYDLERRQLVDDMRDYRWADSWTSEADTERKAVQGLPPTYETVRSVATAMGRGYGIRIAPSWVVVGRSYFGSGSPELKLARRHVRAGDWDGAANIWRSLAQGNDKRAAKAKYNLALYNEMIGRLDLALERARQAAIGLNRDVARRYVGILQRRINDEARLRDQLGE